MSTIGVKNTATRAKLTCNKAIFSTAGIFIPNGMEFERGSMNELMDVWAKSDGLVVDETKQRRRRHRTS